MVPTDYRLDEVVARLIERLEATRRSLDADTRAPRCAQLAKEHVEAAIGEYRSVYGEDRDRLGQEALLRREVLETFLPRYLRVSGEMEARERAHFGVGWLAEPAGRVVLVVATLLALFIGVRWMTVVYLWPVFALVFSVPAWPDALAWWARRRYLAELQAMVDDMQKIQAHASAYLPMDEPVAERRRPMKEGEWRN